MILCIPPTEFEWLKSISLFYQKIDIYISSLPELIDLNVILPTIKKNDYDCKIIVHYFPFSMIPLLNINELSSSSSLSYFLLTHSQSNEVFPLTLRNINNCLYNNHSYNSFDDIKWDVLPFEIQKPISECSVSLLLFLYENEFEINSNNIYTAGYIYIYILVIIIYFI